MGTWKDFEGINSIKDAYKFKVAENLIINELGSVSDGYNLSHAGTGNSGWSFGGHQYDLSVNKEGRELIQNILDHEYGKEYYLSIEDSLTQAKNPNSLDENTINKINEALSSEYGKALINEDFVKAVDKVCAHIEKVEKVLNISLSNGEKMMLADYHNQYGLSINSSSSASLINKMAKIVEEKHDISKEDIKSLFQETKYYKNTPSQETRVENTYQKALTLDNDLTAPTITKGISDLEDLSKELIESFEINKSEKLNNIESKMNNIYNESNLELRLQLLEEFDLGSNFDNIYSKQLIIQYQDKVVKNKGEEVSNLDFLNMEIVREPLTIDTASSYNNQQIKNEESKYQSFSQDYNSNQNTNSSSQSIG